MRTLLLQTHSACVTYNISAAAGLLPYHFTRNLLVESRLTRSVLLVTNVAESKLAYLNRNQTIAVPFWELPPIEIVPRWHVPLITLILLETPEV